MQLFRHRISSDVSAVQQQRRRRSSSDMSRHRLHVACSSRCSVTLPLLCQLPLRHPQPPRHRLPSHLRRPLRRDRQRRTVPARVLLVPVRLRLRRAAGADRWNVRTDCGSTAASDTCCSRTIDVVQHPHRRPETRGKQTKGGNCDL